MERVFREVVGAPGCSFGLSPQAVAAIWDALGEYVLELLTERKSVIVPNFCHFMLREQTTHNLMWGTQTTWVPQVVLLPTFCSAHRITAPAQYKQVHQGAKTPVILNAHSISMKCGQPRNAVQNAIKDVSRRIGEYSQLGREITVSFGAGGNVFCSVVFDSQHRYGVRWAPSFLASFADKKHAHAEADQRQSPRKGRVSSAGSYRHETDSFVMPPSVSPRVRQPATARAPAPPRRPATARQAAPAAPPAPVPAPPSHEDSPRQSVTPRATPTYEASRDQVGYRAVETPPVPKPPSPRGPSFHEKLNQIKQLEGASPVVKRSLRKGAYRRMRSKAFEDSWEEQLARRREADEEQAAQERAKADAFRQFLVAESDKQRQAKQDRRAVEKKIEDVNKSLAVARSTMGIPRVQPSGDIFDARLRTEAARHDTEALQQQLEEKRREKARRWEEEEAPLLRAMKADQEQFSKDRAAAAARKREEQQRLAVDYEMQINDKIANDAASRKQAFALSAGSVLFSENNGKGDDTIERDVVRCRARKFHSANLNLMRERERQRILDKVQQAEERRAEAERFRRADERLRYQQYMKHQNTKRGLQESWDDQIARKKNETDAERDHMRKWKEMSYLKNESSDEEA